MLNFIATPGFTKHIYEVSSEIPEDALPFIRSELVASLGQVAGVMFPAFAAAFPLTIKEIANYWPNKPKFVATESKDWWVYQVVIERIDLNLFFNKPPMADWDVDGEEFDEGLEMLPTSWKELYRWFDSFCIIENWMGGNVIKNTPFCYSGRLDLESYRQEYGLKKVVVREFQEAIGSKKLRSWMVTDAGDSLWLDEQRCDHKVYHVKNHNFNDVYVLPSPEDALDRYLAHYVSGGKPVDFDFRK